MKAHTKNIIKKTIAAMTITIIGIIFIAFTAFAIYLYTGGSIDLARLDSHSGFVEVYDDDGLLCNTQSHNFIQSYDEIPTRLVDAFVAIEDKRFFSHHGIDYKRICGAIVNNLQGNRLQGASTITQQLIKNTLLTSKQSYDRKLKEAKLAIKLEKMLTKEEIMVKYLNVLYFGSGQYGVKNAAQRFFDKSLDQLNVSECAMLAGIVKSPTKYNPVYNYDNAVGRMNLVLSCMEQQGYINTNSYKYDEIIIKNELNENNIYSVYVENALNEAAKILDTDVEQIVYDGIKIYTYLSTKEQKNLADVICDARYYPDYDSTDAAAIILDNANGGIKALYSKSNINLATFKRQPASIIKPLAAYAPAIDMGYVHPLTMVNDVKTDFGGYSPSNYHNNYLGWTTLKDALKYSQNVPAVKLLDVVGVQRAKEYLSAMNINLDEKDSNLSVALGGLTYGTTFDQIAGGYLTLANYGQYVAPTMIKCIYNAENASIYTHSPTLKKVFEPTTGYFVTDMLKETARTGTGKKLNTLDFEVACKTGTAAYVDPTKNTDAYCAAYTTTHTLLCWLGGKENKPMNDNVTGGGAPTLMAKSILSSLYADKKPQNFTKPQNLVEKRIDKYSYDNDHSIVLAGIHAPQSQTLTVEFAANHLPDTSDESYEDLSIKDFNCNVTKDKINLSFTANPRLNYALYYRNILSKETLLAQWSDKSGKINLTIDKLSESGLLGEKYTLLAYYFDDDGKKIVGIPQTVYKWQL
ncbi:MAG: transglycosylase domain-containing protein [Christensenellales bacterium]